MRLVPLVLLLLAACGSSVGKSPPPPPPCDGKCQDETGVRALRQVLGYAFNQAVQGKPVGDQDATIACPLGGSVHVTGKAASNAQQGSSFVDLTFDFMDCHYLRKDTTPNQNYEVILTGSMTEQGTLAVQPSSTTSLKLDSAAMTWSGSVYDPSTPYSYQACPVTLGQDGSHIDGVLCGRQVGFGL